MPVSVPVSVSPAESEGGVALDELAEHVDMLRQLTRKIEGLTELRAELQRKIKHKLGDAEIGTLRGRPAVTWKRTLRVAVSQKLVKRLYPEIVGEVCDITEVRTFKVLDQ
jgi:predicted phage-related endonuclease